MGCIVGDVGCVAVGAADGVVVGESVTRKYVSTVVVAVRLVQSRNMWQNPENESEKAMQSGPDSST